ncbi:MAG TPA: hypothetical protein VJP77_09565 [Planctomycetota bacterium]|nr:hypothetical protein [Planctomycetota bacterium]
MQLRSEVVPTIHAPPTTIADDEAAATTAGHPRHRLRPVEVLIAWMAIPLWLAVLVSGTLVNSQPYRARFADFQGSVLEVIGDGLMIVLTYTLTNVGLLCMLASALGALGARAGLGPDGDAHAHHDSSSPASSAVLRGFFVYMTVLAGVLVFADRPVEPTQTQYVRLAGLVSLFAFTLNYYPALFANLLKRAGDLGGKA